jgi:hypothetical protein
LITLDDCKNLKESIEKLIDKWDPERDSSCIFSTTDNSTQSKSRYFLDSSENISFFIEEDAVNLDTSLIFKLNIIFIIFVFK